jgi:quinol-cytochrome oxidoreductase complex cytochrome b subunit
VKSVPVIGNWLLQVLRGGTDVTIDTLYRFFAFHVVVLPLAAFAIIGGHLLFVQRQGMAPPLGERRAPRSMRFFPDFALRDVILWLGCLLALCVLAAFLPYGPSIPGMEWDLGAKADPLAPAYPGIKPEWYFLWVYQLLKEFPPHVLGIEGPQLCLLVVGVLLAVWAMVPWLDRRARRGEQSPAFTDLGVAAIIFLSFLTLKAWDVGAEQGASDPQSLAVIAETAAWLVVAMFGAVTALRFFAWHDTWFLLSGAAALHAALVGIAGLAYLHAGVIAAALGALGIGLAALRGTGSTEVHR